MSLNTNINDPAQDSYVETTQAQTWAEKLPWGQQFGNDEDTDKIDRFLRQAVMLMQGRPWQGARATATQALDWGRLYVSNPDFLDVDFAYNVIPDRLWMGQVEWAVFLYKARKDPTIPTVTEQFDEVQVGPIKIRSKGSGGATRSFSKVPAQTEFIKERLAMPPQVLRHLGPLMKTRGIWHQFERIS